MNPRDEPDEPQFYYVEDKALNRLLKRASVSFKAFTSNHNHKDLQESMNLMEEALRFCESRIQNVGLNKQEIPLSYVFDHAHCLRKWASIIVRDQHNEDRYQEAEQMLRMALTIYQKNLSDDKRIVLEHQRALHQMRKIAYELKDGPLLEKAANKLICLLPGNPPPNFLLDCYESLFHVAFAKGDFSGAEKWVNKSLTLAKENGLDASLHLATLHLVKLRLAILQKNSMVKEEKKIYFSEKIEKLFWEPYDAHKKAFKDNPSSKNATRLLKDLVFLFSIRCQKRLLGLSSNNPMVYVLNQAEKIFNTKDNPFYKRIAKVLNAKKEDIKAGKNLTLDYQLFAAISPPCIVITKEEADRFFPASERQRMFRGQLSRENEIGTTEKLNTNKPH